ncbi:P1 family peptidase [Virgibacillus oceani]|uniref:Peptidase n=1 Tax=Virgibacillus oceani TaxID=1479511 RepID=A0A917H2V1_9BACI|nr:P1 family peptidase [Virgibacillus oceani]GGG65808.1 peptidase [Virgibacillus oceani]
MKKINITEINGFYFGHAHDVDALTGCTVIISKDGAIAGVDVRGGSPGTRETDVLNPVNLVEEVHAVFLSGGSAFGLDVGGGIMKYLEEQGIGFDVQVTKVPIVSGTILFDLFPGDSFTRPDKKMGYTACQNAFNNCPFIEGSVGAGIGATVGKGLGYEYAMRGGIGIHAVQIGELQIGAVIAVNAFGDIVDLNTNQVLAGMYDRKTKKFMDSGQQIQKQLYRQSTNRFSGNTTIGAVVTNAKLSKSQANKIASIAHDGYARAIRPSHTFVDGDTVFTLSSNRIEVDLNSLSMLAVEVVEQAIYNAVLNAKTVAGIPSFAEVNH